MNIILGMKLFFVHTSIFGDISSHNGSIEKVICCSITSEPYSLSISVDVCSSTLDMYELY